MRGRLEIDGGRDDSASTIRRSGISGSSSRHADARIARVDGQQRYESGAEPRADKPLNRSVVIRAKGDVDGDPALDELAFGEGGAAAGAVGDQRQLAEVRDAGPPEAAQLVLVRHEQDIRIA